MNRKEHPKNKEKMETIKKISIPYVKGVSERLSRTFKRYKIGTIHKPTTTIKNALCSKLKDQVHPMDKSNSIYKFECNKCDKIYIGETERSLRYRAYEHKIITREESKTAHSLIKPKTKPQANQQPAPSSRPRRNTTRHNYAALHSGSDIVWNETPDTYTDIAKHIREDHNKENYTFKLVTTEAGWRKRTLKEALMIQREDPSRLLNENLGKHTYSNIYQLRRTNPDAEESPSLISVPSNNSDLAQQAIRRPATHNPEQRETQTPSREGENSAEEGGQQDHRN